MSGARQRIRSIDYQVDWRIIRLIRVFSAFSFPFLVSIDLHRSNGVESVPAEWGETSLREDHLFTDL